MQAKRLSNLSCNHEKFAKAFPEYEEAMRRSGHKSELNMKRVPTQTKEDLKKEKLYGSIHHIVSTFAPTSVGNSADS